MKKALYRHRFFLQWIFQSIVCVLFCLALNTYLIPALADSSQLEQIIFLKTNAEGNSTDDICVKFGIRTIFIPKPMRREFTA